MSKYGRHNLFQKQVMIYLQKQDPKLRIWNNATGSAYPIPFVKNLIKAALSMDIPKIKDAVYNLRLIKYGKIGSADMTGILADGRRIEVEIKTGKAVQSIDQKNFQKMIEDRNGIYLLISNQKPIEDQVEYEY